MKRIALYLGIVQLFIAIGAIPAGLLMIIEPDGTGLGMSTGMLSGSPFHDFFIPGLFLLIVNGLFHAFGGVLSLKSNQYAGNVGIILGIFLLIWICVQVYYINPIHILQIIYFVIGIIELLLGYKLNALRS